MDGISMKEIEIYKDIDTMIRLVNKYSKLDWHIEKADNERYYLYRGQNKIAFSGEYAAWCFLTGYALALHDGKNIKIKNNA